MKSITEYKTLKKKGIFKYEDTCVINDQFTIIQKIDNYGAVDCDEIPKCLCCAYVAYDMNLDIH